MRIVTSATATVVAVAMLGLAGCTSAGPNEQAGTLLGAIAGGLAGAQFGKGGGRDVMIGVGALLGGAIGGNVGRSMDAVDRQLMSQETEHALNEVPSNQTTQWRNPDNGHAGTITPRNTTEPRPGIYCREYQQTVTIGGQTEQAYGTACRQPDGSWKIQG